MKERLKMENKTNLLLNKVNCQGNCETPKK